MRLAEFLVQRSESILAEFEHFARSHTTAGAEMDIAALRDHAAAMLAAIALDLTRPQTVAEGLRKSTGDAPDDGGPRTAAEQHGTDRALSGFTLGEMFAEYRALRASVLRLWSAERGRADERDLQDLIRLNEAIDQALAESVDRYATSIDHSREMFLAVLGHDLRTPISAIVTAAGFMESKEEADSSDTGMPAVIRRSGERMSRLVDDLLDFTLSRLGRGIPVECIDTDLDDIARAAIEEVGAAHPGRELHYDGDGDLHGCWDVDRLRQALANLIGNAIQHGAPDSPIRVAGSGDAGSVRVTVHNVGTMPSDDRRHIFDPFKRLAPEVTAAQDRRSMGLGLYIAEQIVIAHHGEIDVESSPMSGTTFSIRLPRQR